MESTVNISSLNTSHGLEKLILHAWNGLEDSDDIHIQCYHAFLTLGHTAGYLLMLAQEQQQA